MNSNLEQQRNRFTQKLTALSQKYEIEYLRIIGSLEMYSVERKPNPETELLLRGTFGVEGLEELITEYRRLS